MIPQNDVLTLSQTVGSEDFALKDGRMGVRCSGRDALTGWVALALSTERYAYPIFSDDYGLELRPGMRVSDSQIARAICEALECDRRVSRVDGFIITKERGTVSARFTVHSVYGDLDTEINLNV